MDLDVTDPNQATEAQKEEYQESISYCMMTALSISGAYNMWYRTVQLELQKHCVQDQDNYLNPFQRQLMNSTGLIMQTN